VKRQKPYQLIISGGGTGGHIFPAIAIADKFREKYPDANILFIGAKGKMEMNRVPKAGYKIEGLWISGLHRRLTLQNVLFPLKVIVSYMVARSLIKKIRPDAVVGTGGFASGPIMMAATNAGVPALIQEQNSYAGLANKKVAKKANKICVAYEGMEKFFPADKIILTGNPVRQDISGQLPDKEAAADHWGLSTERPVVLILGGSLGARTINDSVLESIALWIEEGIQVIWQTGRFYFGEMNSKAAQYINKGIVITEFIDDMKLAYSAADLIVSRAGALSVSEHCLVKKPVIYVPSPNVAEDHQRKNAKALVKKEAALMISDKEARLKLGGAVMDLLKDPEKQKALSENIGKLAKPSATEDIVKEIEKLIH
jgi:UDP-N-acetylglucosamine--N-acetylmuramyl-(pentapeptide) pyrophosphoryl-undecaprenol N-acetylglucosamine transferase